jgi:PPIC-type PPIASE domain/SurA N-terminal domain
MVITSSRLSGLSSFSKYAALLAVAVGAILLPACKQAITDPNDPKFIVAEKGNWQITKAELDVEVANFLKQRNATPEQIGPAKMPIVQTAMLKNMVLKKMILDHAAALQLADVDKECAAELDKLKGPLSDTEFEGKLKTAGMSLADLKQRIHDKVVIGKVLDAEAFKNTDPTDAEINDFYVKNKASITAPPQVRASRILVHLDEKMTADEKKAKKKIIDKAYSRVMHGEEFSKVATEISEDRSSAPKGGDLDYFQPNENEPGFDVVAFSTKQGAVSPVFETSLGYQFIKVTDVKPGGPVPLADVRPKIAAFLKQQKMQQQSQDYATKLLADPSIKYHLVLVDPPAQTMGGPGGPGAPPSGPDSSAPPSDASAPPASEPPPAPPATSAPPQ